LHDKADDVANLLRAIYDGPFFKNNDPDDFRVVSGILRLTTKYIIESLRTRALNHLRIAWPTTLKEWDAREDIARSYDLGNPTHRGFRYPSPIAVIQLARENNAPELLPAAFYDLSRYHFHQIYEPAAGEPLSYPPLISVLAPDDIQRLALGKEASLHFVTTLIQSMANGAHPARQTLSHLRRKSSENVCVSAAACKQDFEELVELATQHYLFDRERGCTDPLYVAEELGQLKSAEFSECKPCAKALERWAIRERERMWNLIPTWFRLRP